MYLGSEAHTGSGIGRVDTMLSFSPQGNDTAACGQITFGDVVSSCGGNTQFQGGANNQTYTFGELGLTDASDLRIIFNVNEPDNAVTLNSLSALFYRPDGTLYHTATYSPAGGRSFAEVGGGIGGQGHVFGLDDEQAQFINLTLAAGNVLGLRSALSNAAGGFETFNVGTDEGTPGTSVPEPSVVAMLGLGLTMAGSAIRRRSRR